LNFTQIKGCGIDFSSNFKFFKTILEIPSIKDLNIKNNKLGKNGLNYLCEFIQENKTLEYLEFSGKGIKNNHF
jgi:Ran GTPase-activating protein (RanGAP) involved in mRNA processing and transport